MSQKKHSAEWIIGRVEEYIDGKGSYSEISRSNGIGETTLKRWVSKYRAQGAEAFAEKPGNARYSKEFKRQCGKLLHLFLQVFQFKVIEHERRIFAAAEILRS